MSFLISFISIILFSLQTANAQLSNESELGIASANGNTKTQTYNFKQANDYKVDKNELGFRSRYLDSKANETRTARYFMAGVKFAHDLSEKTNMFIGETFEKDRFAKIDERFITDVGGKYRFIESDTTKFFSELGYRYMHENRIDGTSVYGSYVRLYTEWERKWNANFSTKYGLELLPNISEEDDWQANTELSMSAILTDMLSIKTGFLLRHDNLPAPGVAYKTDTLFTTSLVAKF
jgi:putative salt-induced outer membrane protein YdiY